jgi:mono/diheme cytochrome c family protein
MNPRVPGLRSADVQEMSDKEIFWVIKNGIRLSGMPGFAKLSTDPEIWQMTYYVRSLGARSVK